jgi:hypothetical protein
VRLKLGRIVETLGVTYAPDQPLWTRATYPFRVCGVVLFLLLGPALLWMAFDNVMTGRASLSFQGRSQTVTREQLPSFFWLYTAITAGVGLLGTVISAGVLYGATTDPEDRP